MHILHILGSLIGRVLEDVGVKTEILPMLCQISQTSKKEAHTGVSKAKQAIMFGQRGAWMSGRVWINSLIESAARKPPILCESENKPRIRREESTYL
jgi:hypothetical protein